MKKLIFIIFLILIIGANFSEATQLGQPEEPQIPTGEVQVEWEKKRISVCPPGIFGSLPCEYPEIVSVIQKIWDFVLNIAPLTLVALLIIGGFMYLLSPFDVRKIKLGHRYIQWAVYGYIILLLISLIFTFISAVFGGPKL